MQQPLYPTQQHPVTTSVTIPHKERPTQAKLIPSERPNTIEDDDGKIPTYFQRIVHISLSGTHIILPDVHVPPPRVLPVQPPRVETGGPSSNLRYSCKKILSQTLHWQHNYCKLEKPTQLPIKYSELPSNIDIWLNAQK